MSIDLHIVKGDIRAFAEAMEKDPEKPGKSEENPGEEKMQTD